MTYAAEHILQALKKAREAMGLSQRALSARTGVPQSHISKIESGGADIRVSSLIEIARALDLELKLVPRKAVPAVDTVVQSTAPALAPSGGEAQRELRRINDTVLSLRQLYPDVAALHQLQRTLGQLRTLPVIGNSALEAIRNATAPLRALEKTAAQVKQSAKAAKKTGKRFEEIGEAGKLSAQRLKELQKAASALQQLRNTLAHNAGDHPVALPAYRLDDDGEARDG